MKYLLDTNTCIRYINGRAPQIREHMRTVSDSDIVISTATKGEIYAGSAKSQTPRVCQDFGVNGISFKEAFFLQSEWQAG